MKPNPVHISLCAIAYNEEALIEPLLQSVQGVADEVVLGVDSRTTDGTERIAWSYGAKTFRFDWCDDFAYARNLTLERAVGDWILILDADERLTTDGANIIRELVASAPDEPPSDAVTGMVFLEAQCHLDGSMRGVTRTSGRMWRNSPRVRYRGVVHEEPLWTDRPDETVWLSVSGAIAMQHVGYDPQLWRDRGKRDRNIALLQKRIAADPNDEHARTKLALQLSTLEPYTVLTRGRA